MPALPVTLTAAALFALFYFALSIHVVRGRLKYQVSMGHGGNADLLARVRTHANFAEYVPFCLILFGLLEANGAKPAHVATLAAVLIVARLCHVVGMPTLERLNFRRVGMMGTWLVMVTSAVYGLVLVLA